MIPSFEIKNYRLFKHLVIERLGRVNLITGKNNVGKTALLEALLLYISKVSLNDLYPIFLYRSELSKTPQTFVQSFFYYFKLNEKIVLGPPIKNYKKSVNIRYVSFIDEWSKERTTFKRRIVDTKTNDLSGANPGLEVKFDKVSKIIPLNQDYNTLANFEREQKIKTKCLIVPSCGVPIGISAILWDQITLTPLEKDVLENIKIIEPSLAQIAFVAHNEKENQRQFLVKVDNFDGPVNISILGEGVKRLFGIVLSLVYSKGGTLLIDEIENGIHYSIQPKLWNLILEMAERLDVQVFATTHSWDSVEGFQQALKEFHDPEQGQLIRLKEKNGDIKATIINAKDLAIATRDNIEVR